MECKTVQKNETGRKTGKFIYKKRHPTLLANIIR